LKYPAYDIGHSYDWNYERAPQAARVEVAECPGEWDFCGLRVNSPLGIRIPAGPLLNSGWIRYYASLGFDVLTYKTVRSRYRASYEPPNLVPVEAERLEAEGGVVREFRGSEVRAWAISFGMPSRDPAVWREDVERARRGMGVGQVLVVLVVSVVASPEAGWGMEEVAHDFARCAEWARDAGAQAVEANLSCPNVCTKEADL
jgi:dihydroorotate dehydrogenase (NAD+) catalytic subunit